MFITQTYFHKLNLTHHASHRTNKWTQHIIMPSESLHHSIVTTLHASMATPYSAATQHRRRSLEPIVSTVRPVSHSLTDSSLCIKLRMRGSSFATATASRTSQTSAWPGL